MRTSFIDFFCRGLWSFFVMSRFGRIGRTGLVYLSGVIGAGFITGREIYSYFGRFGVWGFLGILVSTGLFAITASRMMRVIKERRCRDMRDTAAAMLGEGAGGAVCAAQSIFLFCMYVVMLAGAAELLQKVTPLPRSLATAAVSLAGAALLFAGFKGIAAICAWAAPVAALVMLAPLAACAFDGGGKGEGLSALFGGAAIAPRSGNIAAALLAVAAAAIYCSYNLIVLLSVMPRVAEDTKTLFEARAGGVLGAVFVGALLLAVNAGLAGAGMYEGDVSMPLLELAAGQSKTLEVVMIAVILGTMTISAAVNLSNCGRELAKIAKCKEITAGLALAVVGYGLSFVGFGRLMDILYTFFGVLGLVLIIPLVFRRK